jgi:hypothetical protein
MRVLFDIVHPAHVHFFKHIIRGVETRGHETTIIARDKDVTLELLDHYGFNYTTIGISKKKSRLQQLRELLIRNRTIWRIARKFKPDIILTRNPSGVQVARLVGATGIFDTDDGLQAGIHFRIAAPFAHYITTPDCISENYGRNHLKYPGYKQTAYLHPDHFVPNPKVIEMLDLRKGTPFFLVRFVDMIATHDKGECGLDYSAKLEIIRLLKTYGRVFISSESRLPDEWQSMQIKIPAHLIHDVLAFATLVVGDSQSMSAEAAVIGTPALRVSSFANRLDVFKELEETYGLVRSYHPADIQIFMNHLNELLNNPEKIDRMKALHAKMISEKCNVAKWFIDLVENIGASSRVL